MLDRDYSRNMLKLLGSRKRKSEGESLLKKFKNRILFFLLTKHFFIHKISYTGSVPYGTIRTFLYGFGCMHVRMYGTIFKEVVF